jgi:hypothetical protein
MNTTYKWVKPLPEKQINTFEDRVVYNSAVYTREFTKGTRAYPRLSGELERQEIASPIVGSSKSYGLTAGVKYAGYVWNMKNVNWTNPNTKPKWYYSVFVNNSQKIIVQAISSSLKEI